jgi:hypothetical protein
LCFFFCPSVHLLSLYLYTYLSNNFLLIYISVCLPTIFHMICQTIFLSVYISICLLSVFTFCVYLSVFPKVHFTNSLCICKSICPSVYLSVCPSVCLYIYKSLLEFVIRFQFSANLGLKWKVFHDIDTKLVLIEDPVRKRDVKLKTRGGGFKFKLITTSVSCLKNRFCNFNWNYSYTQELNCIR